MRISKAHILLGALAFAIGGVISLIGLRERTEPLTTDLLRDARTRWEAHGIADYDLRYRMHGSLYAVSVRGGIVISMRVDGIEPRSADLAAYSVEGLFDTLEMELEGLADPRGPFAGGNRAVLMRVRFNASLGYVERYLRSGGGGRQGVAIEVLAFEPINNVT